MARQALVYADKDKEDQFVVELLPKDRTMRIFLAQIPPAENLKTTIDSVSRMISKGSSKFIGEDIDTLQIPVINFSILKRYTQFEGRRIVSQGLPLEEDTLRIAAQSIEFSLDHSGAILKSRAFLGCMGFPSEIVFDKPFLLLLQKRGESKPCFALWVENSELLVPFKKEAK